MRSRPLKKEHKGARVPGPVLKTQAHGKGSRPVEKGSVTGEKKAPTPVNQFAESTIQRQETDDKKMKGKEGRTNRNQREDDEKPEAGIT